MKCSEKAFQGKLITFPERRCRSIKRPNLDLEETCNRGPCPARPGYSLAAAWYSSPWQQVSTQRLRGAKLSEIPFTTAVVRDLSERPESLGRF